MATCLIESVGLSADCAICYAAFVGCFYSECTAICMHGDGGGSDDPGYYPDCGCEACLEWIGCDCTGDLASACDGHASEVKP
jgi:hypothetical protein